MPTMAVWGPAADCSVA